MPISSPVPCHAHTALFGSYPALHDMRKPLNEHRLDALQLHGQVGRAFCCHGHLKPAKEPRRELADGAESRYDTFPFRQLPIHARASSDPLVTACVLPQLSDTMA